MASTGHPLLDLLAGYSTRNHRETIATIQAAGMAQANQAMHHNRRRMDAQVDAALRSKCGDNYQAPSEDMGPMILNSPIIGDDALNKLTALVNANVNASANVNGQLPPQTGATNHQPAPTPGVAPGATPGVGRILMTGLGKMLPLLAAAGLSTAVTIAATKYFAPTDHNNAYEIEAIPYQPSESSNESQPTSIRDHRDRPWS